MAIDLVASFSDDHSAIQEAASAGLRTMDHLIRLMSAADNCNKSDLDFREATDSTVARFKQVISILNRTGHARFRRGPTKPIQPEETEPIPEQTKTKSTTTKIDCGNNKVLCSVTESRSEFSASQYDSSASFVSSVTGDGSVSNGKVGPTLLFPPPAVPTVSAGKPPLAGRKRCHESLISGDVAGKTSSASCHCHKRRKNRFKKSIRTPAISSKVADIPQDEYSWRKYGQKPIKGSPYPRGYYKCSTVKGCPARKHVERAKDDPAMLIVTYEWEHRHPSTPVTETAVDGSARGRVFPSTR